MNIRKNTLRKRPKDEDVDHIPQINLIGYFSGPLTNPIDMFMEMLTVVHSRVGEHVVDYAIHPIYGKETQIIKNFHDHGPLSVIQASFPGVASYFLAGRDLGVLGASVSRRWSIFLSNERPRSYSEDYYFQFVCYMDEDTLGDLLEGTQRLSLVRDMVAVLDKTGQCYYGFVDADEAGRVDYGHYYGVSFEGYSPWRYCVNKVDWLADLKERRSRVRFPSWGTYLGPDLAAKANKIGDLYKEYTARKAEEPDQYAERFDSGGMFLAVGKNPMDTVYLPPERSGSAPVQNAAWLWSWFRRAGMI